MAVVLDSSVWVSALIFGGGPLELLEAGLDGSLDIAISQSIIDETLRVMREKFDAKLSEIERAYAIMTASSRLVAPVTQVKVVKDDPNDDHVVSCAVAAGASAIVTGDKHLLRMREYEGIKMLRVRDVLQRGR